MPRKLNKPGKDTSYEDAIHYMRNAIPQWFEWPRELRRVYMLLDSHGASAASMESICNTLGYKLTWLEKIVKKVPSFQEFFDKFAEERLYPVVRSHSGVKERITLKDLAWLFNQESALVYLVALEQDISNKKMSYQHAARMVAGAGFAEQVEAYTDDEPSGEDNSYTDSGLPRFGELVPINGAIPIPTESLATKVPRDSGEA